MPLATYIKAARRLKVIQCVVCKRQSRVSDDDVCSSCHFLACEKSQCDRCADIAVGVVTFLYEDKEKP